MKKKCDCKCHKKETVIYCSKCVYFHKFGVEPPKESKLDFWKREWMKQYYIRTKLNALPDVEEEA